MKFSFTTTAARTLQEVKRKEPSLYEKIQKQLRLFRENHNHPSLRNHKLKGNLSQSWSISIGRNIRMLYYLTDDEAVFFIIGTHDEVYKK